MDNTAQMVKRMATTTMMAPTGLFLPIILKAAIQPLETTSVETNVDKDVSKKARQMLK